MNTMSLKTMVIVSVVALLSGCQEKTMQERGFAEGHPIILCDPATGYRYVVELHAGNVYTVKPLDQEK